MHDPSRLNASTPNPSALGRALAAMMLVLLVPLYLAATTLQRLSLDDMIQKSTGIVRARVAGSYTGAIGPDVYTYYRLQVSETWKGTSTAQMDVAVPGGTLRGYRQIIAGAPSLNSGEEYVLFLWAGRNGITQVIGLSQGLFTVRPDAANNPMMVRAAALETMLDGNGRVVADEPLFLKLSEVRAKVRAVLDAGKGTGR
jgi:hypothetical protein